MVQDGYIYRDSLIHKMNPSLKMFSVIFLIVLVFIPFGFLFQIILLLFILVIYSLAKLPFKRLWKIFVSILFMGLILTLINWVSYKTPGVIFNIDEHFHRLFNLSWLNSQNPNVILLDNKWFIHGDIWGGDIQNYINQDIINAISKITGTSLNSFGNGFYIIDGITDKNIESIQNAIIGIDKNIEFEFANSANQLYLFAYKAEWYGLSSFAIALMAYVTIKIFSMILVISILTSSTSPIEMTYALEDIMSPLKYLKAPVSEWSITIALSIRFIPSLLDESNRVLRAQASRGVDFKNGNSIDKMKSLSSLVVPLFSIAFRKAEELSNAMEARAYNPRNFRTRYRIFQIGFFDWLFFSFILFYLGFLITLVFLNGKPILITPLGVMDAIITLS